MVGSDGGKRKGDKEGGEGGNLELAIDGGRSEVKLVNLELS